MKKTLLSVAGILLFSAFSFAQENFELSPYSDLIDLSSYETKLHQVEFQAPSKDRIAEVSNPAKSGGGFEKSGILVPMNLNLQNSGSWTTLPGGDRIWRLRVNSPGALALTPYFTDFYLPEGSRLHIYNDDKSEVLGAFTSINNHSSKIFASWFLRGNHMILEYFEPLAVAGTGTLQLSNVSYWFRNIPSLEEDLRASGACEVDVKCSEGNSWTSQRDAVVKLQVTTNGVSGFCSGAIINNTAQNCTPYILTAFHCAWDGSQMSSTADLNAYVVRYNYQRANCGSGAVANSSTQTGCASRAWSNDGGGDTGSDFFLFELNANINHQAVNPYFAGWDANTTAPAGGVGIHHPSGDYKKISTFTATGTSTTWGGAVSGTHWRFPWVATTNGHGVTEGGSSGSPIFRASNGLICGTLTGGGSCCTSNGCGTGTGPTAQDYYGKMSYHWTSNGAAANRQLKPWLDPGNSGVLTLNGAYSPCNVSVPENTLATLFSVYPNPSNGIINVEVATSQNEVVQIEVYNSFGQLVKTVQMNSGVKIISIDMNEYAAGIYFVNLTVGEETASKKVIVK